MSARQPAGPSAAPVFPVPGHNHGGCVLNAVDRAEKAFEAKGMKLTRLRRKVFEQIASSHHAVGAYDIIDSLARKGDRLAPISVYRAIDTLQEAGVVHRLECRNAFFACHTSHDASASQVIIACETCSIVAEIDGSAIFQALTDAAEAANFKTSRKVVELTGTCQSCQAEHGTSGRENA